MRVGALVGVLDEVELIEQCVTHLRRCGVAPIVVSDFGSTDGTLERVAAMGGSDLSVVHTRPEEWSTWTDLGLRDAKMARDIDADWVLFMDADEFPIPRAGSIADCVPPDVDALTVPRFNVPLTPSGLLWPDVLDSSTLDELFLYTLTVPDFRAYVEGNLGEPFIAIAPGSKVMARPDLVLSVDGGQHDARLRAPAQRAEARDLVIAHVPFTNLERFARRVQNIRAEMRHHPQTFLDGWCWHWSRWVALDDAGRLGDEFDRQVLTETGLERARRVGFVQSASDWFERSASAEAR